MQNRSWFGTLLLAAAVSVAPGIPVLAAERDRSGVIEEIIVTSQRRAESIQDVPISVTAFNQEDIERISPRTLRDLDAMVPNVRIGMVTAAPGQGAIFIRGLGYADAENNQPPSVGLIIDNIFQGTNTGQLIDTFDIEQIEVNRGPQGVLYGKNTTGGTIVVKRAQPRFNEFGFDAAAQVGTENERILKAKVNLPLIDDRLAMKIGGIHKERDGFFRNITLGGDAGADEYDALTFALRWQPTEAFEGVFTYDLVRQRGDIPPQDPRWNGDDPFVNEADYDEFQELDVDMFGLTLNVDLGFATLESITGYIDSTDVTGQDFDGSTLASLATPLGQLHTHRDRDYQQFSQELKLAGDLNERISYMVGAFWWDAEFDFQQGTNSIIQVPIGLPCAVAGLPSSPLDPNLCQLPQGILGPPPSVQLTSESVESKALFASLDWRATDTVTLSAGVRWLDEKKQFDGVYLLGILPTSGPTNLLGINLLPPLQYNPNVVLNGPFDSKDSWNDTIFRFTANWAVTDDNMLYATFAQGFKSGGLHNRGTEAEFLAYEPESVDTLEIGSKNVLLDGRLRLNASAFHSEISDLQAANVITISSVPGTNTIVNNLPKRTIWGVEVETSLQLTETLTLMLMGGYLKADTDDYTLNTRRVGFNPSGSNCNPTDNPALFPNAPATNPNNCPDRTFTAGDIAFVPEWNYAATLAYSSYFAGGALQASVTARGQDDIILAGLPPPDAPLVQKAYTLIDARVSYQWTLGNDDTLRLSLYGKNLTDKEYKEQILALGRDGGFQGWGPPRQVALELVYSH
ncbi:MAG: TonB-dependent receptor [Pseudomonadales bacterium]|nr:TonB-dependent receptor [Pseudomonadales bacterium]